MNIQVTEEFECQMLNRDTWSNPSLAQFIKSNFKFWQGKRETSVQYCTYHSIIKFPHISIIDPITGLPFNVTTKFAGERIKVWEGKITAEELLKDCM